MNYLRRFQFFLAYFGRFKVPLIGHLRPKLYSFNEEELVVRLRLNRRSKNHLNSMYFGALAVGADLAGGLHAFYFARKEKLNLALVFKSFQAQFLRRAESDVYFVCSMGQEIKKMIDEAHSDGERHTKAVIVSAWVNYPNQPEQVASFSLELSVKIAKSKD